MPRPDVELDLPEGWSQTQSGIDEPLGFAAPDGGALQLSAPSWGSRVRAADDLDELLPFMQQIVEAGQLGTLLHAAAVELPYGRALVGEVDSKQYDDVAAWLVVPDSHDVLLVTWIGTGHGDVARELVGKLRPGLFSAAIASAVGIAGKALANDELFPHAALFGNGTITHLGLSTLPHEYWDDACRHERARTNAEIVVQVLAARTNGRDVAVVYGESRERQRRMLVGAAPRSIELPADERTDFFAAANADVARALDAARR